MGLYYKLNAEHPDVKRMSAYLANKASDFISKDKIDEIVQSLYHAEIKLTQDGQEEGTRLSFGPNGLREFALNDESEGWRLHEKGIWGTQRNSIEFGEHSFSKRKFIEKMKGCWESKDYHLTKNNCIHFAQAFITQVSAPKNGSPNAVDQPRVSEWAAFQKMSGIDIYHGCNVFAPFYELAQMFAPDVTARLRNEIFSAFSDEKPLCVYRVAVPDRTA